MGKSPSKRNSANGRTVAPDKGSHLVVVITAVLSLVGALCVAAIQNWDRLTGKTAAEKPDPKPSGAGPTISSSPQSGTGSTQIVAGSINSLSIGPPAAREPAVPQQSKLMLASFSMDSSNSAFRETRDFYKPGRGKEVGIVAWETTDKWSDLMDCRESDRTNKCRSSKDLSAVFIATLQNLTDVPDIMTDINVKAIKYGMHEGSAGDLNSAAIPISAKYVVNLPKVPLMGEGKPWSHKQIANPPLQISKGTPGRFEIELRPDYPATCYYILQIEFLFSSGKRLATTRFFVNWNG